jgi:hypothetical protein
MQSRTRFDVCLVFQLWLQQSRLPESVFIVRGQRGFPRIFLKKNFRLIREIRVPTGFISDFAQAMVCHLFVVRYF